MGTVIQIAVRTTLLGAAAVLILFALGNVGAPIASAMGTGIGTTVWSPTGQNAGRVPAPAMPGALGLTPGWQPQSPMGVVSGTTNPVPRSVQSPTNPNRLPGASSLIEFGAAVALAALAFIPRPILRRRDTVAQIVR